MSKIVDLLLITARTVWATLQGAWLLSLYLFVGYIMVGSLGSLQLRDTLEAENNGASYDEVIRAKQDFEKKLDILSARSNQKINSLFTEYEQIEEERYQVWVAILNQAYNDKLIDSNSTDMSNEVYSELLSKLNDHCATQGQYTTLCDEYATFNRLSVESNRAINQAENATNEAQHQEILVDDPVAKLRAETPFHELFSTVDFMNSLWSEEMLKQPRELLVLQLTMVMGMLGSLVAMTWSYIRRETSMNARRTLFLPLVGSISAFIIFVFLKAGQLTISSGSGTSLSPFFLSFVGIISGLLSERAYARMESVGTKFFTVDDDNVRWAVRLRAVLDESGVSLAELANYLGCEESTAKSIVDELSPANLTQQRLIAACLRCEVRELFTDAPPKSILNQDIANGTVIFVEVPNVLGSTVDEAQNTLKHTGLSAGTISDGSDTEAKLGTVIDQIPSAGQQAARGSEVALIICKEPDS